MPDVVINRVEELAKLEKQPLLNNGAPIFEWQPGVPIEDDDNDYASDDDDEQLQYENNEENDYDLGDDTDLERDNDDIESDDDEDNVDDNQPETEQELPYILEDEVNEIDNDNHNIQQNAQGNEETIPPNEEVDEVNNGDKTTDDNEQHVKREDENQSDDDATHDDLRSVHDEVLGSDDNDEDNDTTPNVTNPGRPRRSAEAKRRTVYVPSHSGKSYAEAQLYQKHGGTTILHKVQLAQLVVNEDRPKLTEAHKHIVNFMFNQMSAKKGFKQFGTKAVAAMIKEYNQLNDMKVFSELDPATLTPEQKRKALRAVNLIKEKRCGIIKGRTCADGSSQRAYIPREEATSPTVSMESLIATLIIDAKEQRDVAVFDVPGAYLNADMPEDKFVIMKFENEFADIMCDVNEAYKKNITYE